MSPSRNYDVAIIGAGAAGLAAAVRLGAAGRSVLLLEARDRIGGRIWTRAEPGVPAPVELGAEFLHGEATAASRWLRRAGTAPVAVPESHLRLQRGSLQPVDDTFQKLQAALRRHDANITHDMSLETLINERLANELSPAAREYALMMAEGFDAADPARASARDIADEWSGSLLEGEQSRPADGYASLLAVLAGALGDTVHLHLHREVRAIDWSHRKVVVSGQFLGQPFGANARRALLTLPLGVLKAGDRAVRFRPALDAKQAALQGLAAGAVIKIVMLFRTPFWQELNDGRYRDASFFHAPRAAFPTVWTALPRQAPTLTAWVGGPRASRLSADSDSAAMVGHALESLEQLFGGIDAIRTQLVAAYLHDWQRDPFSLGAYSYVAVGGGSAREDLASPLEDTLFFAGEATSQDEAATVAGALQAGERAADQIIGVGRS